MIVEKKERKKPYMANIGFHFSKVQGVVFLFGLFLIGPWLDFARTAISFFPFSSYLLQKAESHPVKKGDPRRKALTEESVVAFKMTFIFPKLLFYLEDFQQVFVPSYLRSAPLEIAVAINKHQKPSFKI